jgi:SAM-dependent methyltransferase
MRTAVCLAGMKRNAPAALRNREPILDVLRDVLRPTSRVLEIGSGTGQHAHFFTEHMPDWSWQPSDIDDANLASIEAYRAEASRQNFRAALRIDTRDSNWPSERYDAVFSANVIHISPWPVALGLLDGAARALDPGGLLVLYGPFRFSGVFTADSNAAFDARLRGEDPRWGVRDLDDLQREALARGFGAQRTIAMPANNHVLVFAR